MKISDDRIIQLLKQNNLKVTPQRLSICRVVLSSTNHPSAEEIYDIVKKEHRTISLATVYKTLNLLNKIGLISELRFNGNFSRYDSKSEVHINIVCPKCMKIEDYESKKLNEIWENILSDIKGDIKGQRIDVYKLCENCK